MEYSSIINHPEQGVMFNLTKSAMYLGISRNKFRRIAPPPGYVQDGIYPFWSKRILDILPVTEDFDYKEKLKKGKECGNYLITQMNEVEIRQLRIDLRHATLASTVRVHKCGLDDLPPMSIPERATWHFNNCDCSAEPKHDEIAFCLNKYGVKIEFLTDHEAMVFLEGIFSAIKEYVRKRISCMQPSEKSAYILGFWRGNYEDL